MKPPQELIDSLRTFTTVLTSKFTGNDVVITNGGVDWTAEEVCRHVEELLEKYEEMPDPPPAAEPQEEITIGHPAILNWEALRQIMEFKAPVVSLTKDLTTFYMDVTDSWTHEDKRTFYAETLDELVVDVAAARKAAIENAESQSHTYR